MYGAVAKTLCATLLYLYCGLVAAADLNEITTQIDAGSYQTALELLAGAGDSRPVRLLRARALSGLNQSDAAEKLYRALIDESPEDPTPYNNLATLYAKQGRLQEASELLSQALKGDERYATIYKNLSSVYVEMSRNAYARALRLDASEQGLQLLSLNYRTEPQVPLQLATVTPPQPAVAAPEKPRTEEPVIMAEPVTDEPAVEPPAEQPMSKQQAVVSMLNQWAAAWSAQNVEAYLGAYDTTYRPRHGLTLEQWRAERRVRLLKPASIQVSLSEFEVEPHSSGGVKVRVLQRYRSDRYGDSTRKGFVLVSHDGEWKIRDEYTIEVVSE